MNTANFDVTFGPLPSEYLGEEYSLTGFTLVLTTGLFIASVFSFTPLNFGYDGPIIKPYEYVIDEALRIFLRYDSACFMAR